MTVNPFDRLGGGEAPAPTVVNVDEEVGGAFSCQLCDKVIGIAHYKLEGRVLYWTCPDGHESKIEGFKLD